jgi:hypothetical protein
LKWLSFTAQKQNEKVLLQWSTASETNVNDFSIERSNDGKDWNTRGTVLSKNNNATNQYSYTDYSPSSGINYYRIRQNDNDGKYSYSKIETVNISEETKPFKLVSNRVVSKALQIEVNSTSNQTISLISNDGKIVWRKKFAQGSHTVSLNELSKGVYYLKGEANTEKIIIP